MVIEMADKTRSTPRGIVENLLVRIDKLFFPVDFVILDMFTDLRMPIILERPPLATAHAKVDIFRKSISLEVGNEKVVFKIKKITTPVESACAIRNEVSIPDDDLMKIDHDFICLGITGGIEYRWNMIDQGEPWDVDKLKKLSNMVKSSFIPLKWKVHWYTIGPGESYTKVRILEIDEIPGSNTNVIIVRAGQMEEMDIDGSVQKET
ncbi:zinc knuckle CX2CX4HX4C containing protein [Tanacetum coccineum]|uniref:Zinc knuckle CX2CX4HX4C containing protein n=1 Tax=Tanacetum coccineum TaxID=301880 RepID=A0ABQ4X0N0_9ASTR